MALFAVEEKRIEDIKFELGMRFERQTISVDGFTDAKDNLFSLSAGAVYDLDDSNRFAVNLSHSERAPNVEELFSFGEHLATQTFEIGDPSLQNEQSFNVDISYRFNMERLSGEINGYWNSYSDFIYGEFLANPAFVTNLFGQTVVAGDEFPVVAYTQQDADIRGIEFHAEWQVVTDAAYELTLGVMADMIEAELSDERDLPRIPPWKAGINIHYDYDLWSAELSYISYAKQDKVSANELPTEGFDMLDFELAYRAFGAEQDFLVFLKGKNLLDEDARDHSSFIKDFAPRPGRSLMLGVRYQF
jgi:iron complex outermembrane receptor protein